jgi:hypothetical protein
MAMAMGDCDSDGNGNCDGNGVGDGDGVSDGDGQRVTITKEGLPLHVAEMCSAFGWATPCLHPHGHKGKCIHQRFIMGVILLRVFAPIQGGGFLTAHHGFFFVYFLQLLFSLLNNPLFAPLHYSGAQEPCEPIDTLPPPLFQNPHQPIDNLPRLLLHFLSR